MAALACRPNSSETAAPRGALLRWLDTLAAWQMRHSHEVISRVQTDSATITGVAFVSEMRTRLRGRPCGSTVAMAFPATAWRPLQDHS